MKVWWILFYLSLYIYNRQIYISAQYFKQFFVGKGIKSGTLLPHMGRKRWEVGWTQVHMAATEGELRKLLPYHSILPLRSIWSIQILFSHAFSIECIWLIQLWWGVWWDMGPSTRGSGCAHRGHDPFPKHNHSSVSLFGYFSFWLLQCPITRHRTKQQIKTRSLGTGCGDIFWGGGQLIEKNLDDET